MDCSICTSMPFMLRPARNTICGGCYDGVRSIITFINKLESDQSSLKPTVPPPNSTKAQPLANVLKYVKSIKDAADEESERLNFLSGFVDAFRDEIHTDISLKPANDGPSIPAHRALLASRSKIFKNMLESDKCKAPANDSVSLPELTHEELQSLMEFLYGGTLPPQKMEKHVCALSLAADKYEIPYLQKFCERHMLESLNSSNVLDVLEISDTCSNQTLKETALNFVVRNMEDIIFSERYDAFALKNPHLCVLITRSSVIEAKSRRNGGVLVQ